MQTKTKLISAGALVLFVLPFVHHLKMEQQMLGRYHQLDPKRVVKAYRVMLANSVRGQYNDQDLNDDSVCEQLFMLEYDRLK